MSQKVILIANSWQEIYCHDDERTMSFEKSKIVNDHIRTIYTDLDYQLIDLPFVSVPERAGFVINTLAELSKNKPENP